MNELPKLFRQKIEDEPNLDAIDIDWLYLNGCFFGDIYWGYDKDSDLDKFRSSVKSHFLNSQNRRCCYCSSEIDENRRLYDLEHIIDKNGRGDLMFELKNLASSCVPCNLSKGKKLVTNKPNVVGEALLASSDDYLIVHPHYDEWDSHFSYDKYDRIVPRSDSEKGQYTFKICSMQNRNILKLSDYFRYPQRTVAESLLSDLYSEHNSKRVAQLKALKSIAKALANPTAQTVVEIVENDLAIQKLLPAKYTYFTGEQWDGKNEKPDWVTQVLNAGGSLDSYENY